MIQTTSRNRRTWALWLGSPKPGASFVIDQSNLCCWDRSADTSYWQDYARENGFACIVTFLDGKRIGSITFHIDN